jgi:hypothetical protein
MGKKPVQETKTVENNEIKTENIIKKIDSSVFTKSLDYQNLKLMNLEK